VGGGQGADELVGDVGEDGGTAGGDAVSGEEDEKIFEEAVEAVEGIEVLRVGGEFGREVVGLEVFGEFGVARAEAIAEVEGLAAAAASAWEEVGAASGRLRFRRHSSRGLGRCFAGGSCC